MNIIYDKLDKCVKPSVFSIFVRYIISLIKSYGLPQNSKHNTWTRVRVYVLGSGSLGHPSQTSSSLLHGLANFLYWHMKEMDVEDFFLPT